MSFGNVKSWDNRQTKRGAVVMLPSGKSWTRRIRWLENENGVVKLKMEDGDIYKEVIVQGGHAQIVYDRFRAGHAIDDCVSILGKTPPKNMRSKRESEKEKCQTGWVLQEIGNGGFAVDDPIEGSIFTIVLRHADVFKTKEEAESAGKSRGYVLVTPVEVRLDPKKSMPVAMSFVK